MTTLARQNAAIDAAIRQTQQKRRRIAVVAIAAVSIIILAIVADTVKASTQLSIAQYKQSQCELMSDHSATNYWYECPAQ